MDLNMGCPVPKVVNNGEGSALMKNPLLGGRDLCHFNRIDMRIIEALANFYRQGLLNRFWAGRGSSIIPERRIGTSLRR